MLDHAPEPVCTLSPDTHPWLHTDPDAKPAPVWADARVLEFGRLQLEDGGALAWAGEDEPSSQEDKVAAGRAQVESSGVAGRGARPRL